MSISVFDHKVTITTRTITLTDDEQYLLNFMSNYEGPTGDELDPMLGSFCDKAGVGEESARQWLYFLARLGLVSLDVNASRSRFFVIEPV